MRVRVLTQNILVASSTVELAFEGTSENTKEGMVVMVACGNSNNFLRTSNIVLKHRMRMRR